MEMIGIIVGGTGMVLFFIGLIIWLLAPSPYTKEVKGVITGLCRNANRFNKGIEDSVHMEITTDTGGVWYPVFEYDVKGKRYKRADTLRRNTITAHAILNKERMIYYNPDKPYKAALSRRRPIEMPCGSLIVIAFILMMLDRFVF